MSADIRSVQNNIEIEQGYAWTTHTGTKEDLVAADFASEDMFPAWPKRVKQFRAPGRALEDKWRVKYRKGARFEVTRWHEHKELPKKPVAWDPVDFKSWLLRFAGAGFCVIISHTSGAFEMKEYGKVTHRLRESDQQKLIELREKVLEVIRQAPVERCDAQILSLVK